MIMSDVYTVLSFCFIFIVLLNTVKILREYERGVIFFLGRFWKVKGPGLIILVPFIQEMVRVDLRTIVMDIPSQDIISKDNISVRVNAVVYFKVIDAKRAIINVEDFFEATSQLAQTTLRSVLGEHELDQMLQQREKLNQMIEKNLDEQTHDWGIRVINVEVKDIDLNESMVRAIAKQAEAERERRAKVIHAQGEEQASKILLEAAQVLEQSESALKLRYLQTLSDIANEKTSTIVFPIDLADKLFTSRK